ncbi:MAG TPA: hypothetical protein VMB02_06935 [Candidatus Aquilonibacter sp.]|nr:hypothetical protein [Candidatus Aquilonibacter sp.]
MLPWSKTDATAGYAARCRIVLLGGAILFLWLPALLTRATQSSSTWVELKGQFGVPLADHKMIVPTMTHVWILYEPVLVNAYNGYEPQKRVDQQQLVDEATPGSQFDSARWKYWRTYRDQTDPLEKELKGKPTKDRKSQIERIINGYWIASTDRALADIAALAQRDASVRTLTQSLDADENGLWSAQVVARAAYRVVARAHFSGQEALWETDFSVAQGKTGIIPPLQPRLADKLP